MTIQEKIDARKAQGNNDGAVSRAVRKAFIRIMCGYVAGTVIGFILRRLIYG